MTKSYIGSSSVVLGNKLPVSLWSRKTPHYEHLREADNLITANLRSKDTIKTDLRVERCQFMIPLKNFHNFSLNFKSPYHLHTFSS